MKLSERAMELLCVIREHTEYTNIDGTETLSRYWVPTTRTEYAQAMNHREVYISGAGVASALKGLCNQGLTMEIRSRDSSAASCYAITEYGITAYEKIRREYDTV